MKKLGHSYTTGTETVENNLALLFKTKMDLLSLRHISQKDENFYVNVNSSFICKSQKLSSVQISFMNKL